MMDDKGHEQQETQESRVNANGSTPGPLSHDAFLRLLLPSLDSQDPDEPADYSLLYVGSTKQRFRRMKIEDPVLYHGVFEAWVTKHRDLFWPNVEREIFDDPPILPVIVPHEPLMLVPPLSMHARLAPAVAEGAAPWLEAYCAYSQAWATRAAQGFHEAIGLWVLSTVAARRICVEFGNPIYPVLFLALVAESSKYTKTTATALGQTLMRRAGCQHFMTPDRSTPQALLRNMGGRIPPDYGKRNEEEQDAIQKRFAFAGQRGWYYEEWGGMLHQMTRQESPMALFHELLRVLDDGKPDFSSETIQRGLDHVDAPYLSLLASATPHDLAPFMAPGDKWWRDGFWPRFAFVVPEHAPVLTRRPQGLATPPSALLVALHNWHTRLGIPTVQIDAVVDAKGRPTGEWKGTRQGPLPCTVLELPADTLEAYYAYNEALLTIDQNGLISPDLGPSYHRLHDKALRIAMLLASMQGHDSVPLAQWAYAQNIVEHWRCMLHTMLLTIASSHKVNKDAQLEDSLETFLAHEGPQTFRTIQRHLHLDSTTLKRIVQAMEFTKRLATHKQGKSVYAYLPSEADLDDIDIKEVQDDVPF